MCDPLSDDDDDISYFAQSIAGNFMGVVQYNKDNRQFEVKKLTNIETLVPQIRHLLGESFKQLPSFSEAVPFILLYKINSSLFFVWLRALQFLGRRVPE